MAEYFDRQAWLEAVRRPDWYVKLWPDYEVLMRRAQTDTDEAETIKEAVRGFFEDVLGKGEVAFGGPDSEMDAQRQPIRQVVIHHSKRKPGYYSLVRLNAVHLLNLYVPQFVQRVRSGGDKAEPISSNHYMGGKMVFYAYHWWVEADGTVTRLLPDEAIGWHAGNWEVNCSSVAICINDDLTDKAPTEAALASVRRIMDEHYGGWGLEVLGHREANPKTACPGNTFLDGWKEALRGL